MQLRSYSIRNSLAGQIPAYVKAGKPLEKDKLNKLINKWQQNNDFAARELLIKHNLKLVYKCAAICSNRRFLYASITQDLIQAGVIGLMEAINKFDPSRGLSFSTYAPHWIFHHINQEIAKIGASLRIPDHALNDFLSGNNTNPAKWAARAHRRISIGSPETASILDAEPTMQGLIDLTPEKIDLSFLLDTLPPKARKILQEHYGDPPKTLQQIGDSLNVTRERIRQIEEQAVNDLREYLNTGIPSFPYRLCQDEAIKRSLLCEEEKKILELLLGIKYSDAQAAENLDISITKTKQLRLSLQQKITRLFSELFPGNHLTIKAQAER
ncbi:MAG: sigma-70 family RNA polymerase sigma factor [Candidatus Margulisiibacteriota bacterium]